jgi:hypothetical protein
MRLRHANIKNCAHYNRKSNKNERLSLLKEIEQDLDTQKTLIQNEENII